MAKKYRRLTATSVFEAKVGLPAPPGERTLLGPPPGRVKRYEPTPAFALHTRATPNRVMSFASRRRNH